VHNLKSLTQIALKGIFTMGRKLSLKSVRPENSVPIKEELIGT